MLLFTHFITGLNNIQRFIEAFYNEISEIESTMEETSIDMQAKPSLIVIYKGIMAIERLVQIQDDKPDELGWRRNQIAAVLLMLKHARNTFMTTVKDGITSRITSDLMTVVDFYASKVNDDGEFIPHAGFKFQLTYVEEDQEPPPQAEDLLEAEQDIIVSKLLFLYHYKEEGFNPTIREIGMNEPEGQLVDLLDRWALVRTREHIPRSSLHRGLWSCDLDLSVADSRVLHTKIVKTVGVKKKFNF